MNFSFHQLFFIFIGSVMIMKAVSHFLRHRKTWRELVVWILLWGSLVVFSVQPQLVDRIALYTGFKSPMNAVIFPTLIIVGYFLARLFLHIEALEQKLAQLARHITLKEKK